MREGHTCVEGGEAREYYECVKGVRLRTVRAVRGVKGISSSEI